MLPVRGAHFLGATHFPAARGQGNTDISYKMWGGEKKCR